MVPYSYEVAKKVILRWRGVDGNMNVDADARARGDKEADGDTGVSGAGSLRENAGADGDDGPDGDDVWKDTQVRRSHSVRCRRSLGCSQGTGAEGYKADVETRMWRHRCGDTDVETRMWRHGLDGDSRVRGHAGVQPLDPREQNTCHLFRERLNLWSKQQTWPSLSPYPAQEHR